MCRKKSNVFNILQRSVLMPLSQECLPCLLRLNSPLSLITLLFSFTVFLTPVILYCSSPFYLHFHWRPGPFYYRASLGPARWMLDKWKWLNLRNMKYFQGYFIESLYVKCVLSRIWQRREEKHDQFAGEINWLPFGLFARPNCIPLCNQDCKALISS